MDRAFWCPRGEQAWFAGQVVDWTQLNDAYGSAERVPALLAAAESENAWEAPVWEELWSRLYHQGTVAPASHAALPALCAMAGERAQVPVDPALVLVAAIVASIDGPSSGATVRIANADTLAALSPVAVGKLRLVTGATDFIWALQTVAALEDLSIWQRNLEGLANGEVELECPRCADHVYLELEGSRLVATADPDGTSAGMAVRPAVESDIDAAEARLLTLTRTHGQEDVASQLLQLFGSATCPACDTDFEISSAFV